MFQLLVAIYLLGIVLGGVPEAGKKPKDEEGKKTSRSADLKTDSSYGLGYGLAYPYYGYGGLGSLRHGLGSVGYGNYGGGYSGYGGKAFILPVYNYGYGGLGYGGEPFIHCSPLIQFKLLKQRLLYLTKSPPPILHTYLHYRSHRAVFIL